MRSLILLLSACCVLAVSAQTYQVKKVPKGSVQVDGKGSSQIWSQAEQLSDFVYPWDSVAAPATSFAALWDGDWFYGLFRVKDDSVITLVKHNDKMEVGASDRVEIFLKKDDTMNPYYCLEMDAEGRVLDYNAFYYRKVNYPWHWPDGQLMIRASRTKDGYILEFAISIQSLKDLGLIRDSRLQAGLFRAERVGAINGRADLRWISWIRPKSGFPDFHIPSAFGTLVLSSLRQ
ncbi:MAG TPA: carbohydrate-binding family 9-like protein [Puia sp.]|nr:carbohydrate-binding family 9-like protein [Puia sp.]